MKTQHCSRLFQKLICLGCLLYWCPRLLPQVSAPVASHAIEVNNEAGEVFRSLQKRISELPAEQQGNVLSLFKENASKTPGAVDTLGTIATNPSTILTTSQSDLTYQQRLAGDKAMIQALHQNTLQVIPGSGTLPAPVTQQGLDNSAKVLNQISPASGPLSASSLSRLLEQEKSIGRLLWTKPELIVSGTPMWQLAGTVFVTGPGIVTTACHTLSGQGDQSLLDIRGTSVALRSGIVLKVEFGDTSQYQTMYTVSGVAAVSGQAGCDVAQLKIDGADHVPPLKIAARNITATRILVVGYPQLDNYSALTCSLGLGGITWKDFCAFHSAYPNVAKIVSPGHILSRDSHNPISVFTYDAPTDGGQSGSPVFDADTLEVIGVHYCCSGAAANSSALACANWHPQNVAWNEAIASETLVSDQTLKPNIVDIDEGASASLLNSSRISAVNP
jgi:hypothetical protein